MSAPTLQSQRWGDRGAESMAVVSTLSCVGQNACDQVCPVPCTPVAPVAW